MDATETNLANAAAETGVESAPVVSQSLSPANQTESKAEKSQSSQGFFGKILRMAGGEKTCTCGKPPGQNGRHKAHCALEKARRADAGHFSAPSDASVDSSETSSASVALPVAPAAPVDRSFYGRVGETLLRWRFRYKGRAIEKKCAPIVGEDEAKALAAEVTSAVSEKEIEDFKECLKRGAERENLPDVHPFAEAALIAINIEGSMWMAMDRIDTRLKAIAASAPKPANVIKVTTP